MLARLQRLLCLLLASLALAWLLGWWSSSPLLAMAGLALPALGYGALLACEFALLARQHNDPAPRPTPAQLLAAWWAEWRSGVQVFFWRQPFREHAEPDHLPPGTRERGVVFVHGLFCNRGFWAPWMRRARALGLPHVAVSLEPVTGSIDAYVPAIDAAVARLMAATGQAPVLVCHSMGGLAARAWLCAMKADQRVHRVITIGSPHHGTWLARFSHLTNGRQMQRQGEWLRCLHEQGGAEGHARFTCWYSNCDNIVFPASTATLDGADNRLVRGVAHVALGFHPKVMGESLALIAAM
jgi:triacylglycerol esterase/lipase EstA (alpha/beta hydrolase family)